MLETGDALSIELADMSEGILLPSKRSVLIQLWNEDSNQPQTRFLDSIDSLILYAATVGQR